MVSGLALIATASIVWAFVRTRITPTVFALLLVAVVATDLCWNAKPFWMYSRAHEELFAPDPIKDYLREQPRPFRVWNVGVYGGSSLMADGIAQWYGHHGNELHAFDVLNGRQGQGLSFQNAGHPNLLDLYAVEYLIIATESAPDSIPGYVRELAAVATSSGQMASLYRSDPPKRYARFVSAAAKVTHGQAVTTVLDARFPTRQLVLLEPEAPTEPDPLADQLPAAVNEPIAFEEWRPGYMKIRMDAAAPSDGYLLISENHYPAWQATVDGSPAPAMRGNGALLTVPVNEGARVVELEYVSEAFGMGKTFTLLSVALIVLAFAATVVMDLRRKAVNPCVT